MQFRDKYLLVGISSLALMHPIAVQAQDPAPQGATAPADEEDKDAIIVTGSRIARAQFDTVEPSVLVSSDQIEQRLFPSKWGVCKKCGSKLLGEYCTDETCPYGDWPQAVPVEAFNTMSELNIPIRYGVPRRLRVCAEVHDDGHNHTVEFDAGPWLYQADENEIVELAAIGWRGDEAADAVALFFEDTNADIASLMAFCRSTQGRRNPLGFECSVDEEQALHWLEQRRPAIWQRVKETI